MRICIHVISRGRQRRCAIPRRMIRIIKMPGGYLFAALENVCSKKKGCEQNLLDAFLYVTAQQNIISWGKMATLRTTHVSGALTANSL